MKTPFVLMAVGLALAGSSQAAPICGCPNHTDLKAGAVSVVVAEVGAARGEIPGQGRAGLRTRFQLASLEIEKGRRPARAWCPGGRRGAVTHLQHGTLPLKEGSRYRLFLDANERILHAEPLDDPALAEAGGSGTGAVGGFLSGETGIPGRFVTPDQGRPIPYYIDADVLPVGLTAEQALNAVHDAFAAWAASTKISFRFAGAQSFGVAATGIPADDEAAIHVQLHDSYGAITSPSALGIGGRSLRIYDYNSDGGGGGTINGSDFHEASVGYVVIRHTTPEAGDATTLAEVLTHEIGHALGLAHSSEDPSESDPALSNAIMYYQIQGGNRGATLGDYDVDTIRKGYPSSGSAPFAAPRTIVGSRTQVVPGMNQISLLARDLDQAPATLSIQQQTGTTGSYGSFALAGHTLTYTFGANYADFMLPDSQIIAGAYYERFLFRVSDGTHLSPIYVVRVVGNKGSPSPALAAPELEITSTRGTVTWTTEPFKTYEVQTRRKDSGWQTRQILWADSTSETSGSLIDSSSGFGLIRVRAHP